MNKTQRINLTTTNVGFISKEMFPHWVRLLIWALQTPKRPYMTFAKRISFLWKQNGKTFTVLYLKECVRLVQAFVSGHPELTTNQFVVGLKGGLPQIIPGTLRSSIRSGDLVNVRGVLSMLSVYRVILIPGKLKVESITDPFNGQSATLPKYELMQALREVSLNRLVLKPVKLHLFGTAGPNHPVSLLGIWKDIEAWKRNPDLFQILSSFVKKLEGGSEFLSLILSEMEISKVLIPGKDLILGRLSEKVEAAGKIRIFAIVDIITQSIMKPLSDGIFKILKSLPMDGTFNQGKPLERLLSRVKSGELVSPIFYSYDLSSATDRLPISFQEQVLSCFMGEEFASEWSSILIQRPWYYKGKPLYYAVGQPMGALSSWAMLALSHHVIVKLAARRVGKHAFTDYALLGDDIVIANESVANCYHEIMTQILGVEINLSKSLISEHSFEFAKRLITFKGEVSPVGAKNLLVGVKSLKGIPSILLDLINKGYTLTEDQVTNMYKSVPTCRKSQLERLSWLVKGPFGFIPTADGLSSRLKMTNSLSAVSMDSLLSSIDEAKFNISLRTYTKSIVAFEKLMTSLMLIDKTVGFDHSALDDPVYNHILTIYREAITKFVEDKPVRRLIFDGPLVFTNFYRATWAKEMMDYITTKVRDTEEVVLPMDPFRTDRVLLPLSHISKSENFWFEVSRIEEEKAVLRGFKSVW